MRRSRVRLPDCTRIAASWAECVRILCIARHNFNKMTCTGGTKTKKPAEVEAEAIMGSVIKGKMVVLRPEELADTYARARARVRRDATSESSQKMKKVGTSLRAISACIPHHSDC